MSKVALVRRRQGGFHNYKLGPRPSSLTKAFPFYCGWSSVQQVCHRLRDGQVHWSFNGQRLRSTHVAVGMRCGQSGFILKSGGVRNGAGWLSDRIPDGWSLCPRCEAKAP